MVEITNSAVREEGKVRTNLWCHECGKDFSVALDYDLDGEHAVSCPHCNHQHYRVIRAGIVTEARWASSGAGLTSYPYSMGAGTTTGTVWFTPVGTTVTANSAGNTARVFLSSAWNRTATST